MIDNIEISKDIDLHKYLCNIFAEIIKSNEEEHIFLSNFFQDFLDSKSDLDTNNCIFEILEFFTTDNNKFDFKNNQTLLIDSFNTYYSGLLDYNNAICNSLAFLMTSLLFANTNFSINRNYFSICDIYLTDTNIFANIHKHLQNKNGDKNYKYFGKIPIEFMFSAKNIHLFLNGIAIKNKKYRNKYL